jgi:hypothetical protein
MRKRPGSSTPERAIALPTGMMHATVFLICRLGGWAAFILTRPLGAVVGDFLDKPDKNLSTSRRRLSGRLSYKPIIVTTDANVGLGSRRTMTCFARSLLMKSREAGRW